MTPASVQVLTSSALFGAITDCIGGVPHHVLRFKETVFEAPGVCVLSRSKLRRSESRSNAAIIPPRDQLWQVAVLCTNRRVLEALDKLALTPGYKQSLHVQLVGITGFAVLYGESDVAFLDWLYDRFSSADQRRISDDTLTRLARTSSDSALAVAQWLLARNYEFPASMMDTAAAHGNLALVRFLHEHSPVGCTTRAMDTAAANGYLDVVQFLHEHRSEGCTRAAQGGALKNGHLDVVRFLCANRSEGCAASAVTDAAQRGHLTSIEFAHEFGFDGFTVWTMSAAVAAGHLDVVKYLHEHRTEGCTLESLCEAEMSRHHDVVDFLCRYRPVANPGAAIKEATRRGHVRLVAVFWLSTVALPGAPRFEYSCARRSYLEICFPEPSES